MRMRQRWRKGAGLSRRNRNFGVVRAKRVTDAPHQARIGGNAHDSEPAPALSKAPWRTTVVPETSL